MTRRRGQLVLLAAAVVGTALVPLLLAYAQVTVAIARGVADDAGGPAATQSLDEPPPRRGEEGRYGDARRGEEQIDAGRLEIAPAATLCIDCAD